MQPFSLPKLMIVWLVFNRKEQELSESNGNNENLLAQIEALKKKIRELEVTFKFTLTDASGIYFNISFSSERVFWESGVNLKLRV